MQTSTYPTTRPRLIADPFIPAFCRSSLTEKRAMVSPPPPDQLEKDLRQGINWWYDYGARIWAYYVFVSGDKSVVYFANIPFNKEVVDPMTMYKMSDLKNFKPKRDEEDSSAGAGGQKNKNKKKSYSHKDDKEYLDPIYFLTDDKHWLLWLLKSPVFEEIHKDWHFDISYISTTLECSIVTQPNESILVTSLPMRIKPSIPMFKPSSSTDEWVWFRDVMKTIEDDAVKIPNGDDDISYMHVFFSVMTRVVFQEHPLSFYNYLLAMTYLYYEIPTHKYICFVGMQGSFKSSLMRLIMLLFYSRSTAEVTITELTSEGDFNSHRSNAIIKIVHEAGGEEATDARKAARLRDLETAGSSIEKKKFKDNTKKNGRVEIMMGIDRKTQFNETTERRYYAINTSAPSDRNAALIKKFETLLVPPANSPVNMFEGRDKFLVELANLLQVILVFLKKNNPDLNSHLEVPPELKNVITSVIQRGEIGATKITWAVPPPARKRSSYNALVCANEMNGPFMTTLTTMIRKMSETGSSIPPIPEAFAALFHENHSVAIYHLANNDSESVAHITWQLRHMWSAMKAQEHPEKLNLEEKNNPFLSLRDIFDKYQKELKDMEKEALGPVDPARLYQLRLVYFMRMANLTRRIGPICKIFGTKPQSTANCVMNIFAITRWFKYTALYVYLIWYNFLDNHSKKIDWDRDLWGWLNNKQEKPIDARMQKEWIHRTEANLLELLCPSASSGYIQSLSNISFTVADVLKHLNHGDKDTTVQIQSKSIPCSKGEGCIVVRPKFIDVGPFSMLVRLSLAMQSFTQAGIEERLIWTIFERCTGGSNDIFRLTAEELMAFCRLASSFPGSLEKVFKLYGDRIPGSLVVYQLLQRIIHSRKLKFFRACSEAEFIDLKEKLARRSFCLPTSSTVSPNQSQGEQFDVSILEKNRKRALSWLDGDDSDDEQPPVEPPAKRIRTDSPSYIRDTLTKMGNAQVHEEVFFTFPATPPTATLLAESSETASSESSDDDQSTQEPPDFEDSEQDEPMLEDLLVSPSTSLSEQSPSQDSSEASSMEL